MAMMWSKKKKMTSPVGASKLSVLHNIIGGELRIEILPTRTGSTSMLELARASL